MDSAAEPGWAALSIDSRKVARHMRNTRSVKLLVAAATAAAVLVAVAPPASAAPTPPSPVMPRAVTFPTAKVWVHTFADAPGMYGGQVGWLRAGRNYVYCAWWKKEERHGNQYNHWWMWTDLDSPKGTSGWVSAYYLSRWGNDEAKDINGRDIPLCFA